METENEKMECTKVSVSNEDIFEVILHICFKKKQRLDIKGAFNYLTKLKKMEDVSFDFFKPETINLDKQGKVFDTIFNGTDSFYIAEKKGFNTTFSTPGLQTPSIMETHVANTSYNNTELLLKTGLKSCKQK